MTTAPHARSVPEPRVGCVVGHEVGVALVLTDGGPVRASYGARLLGAIARDRSCEPQPGDWVVLRTWCDGPVTVERALGREPVERLAPVVRLHPRAT